MFKNLMIIFNRLWRECNAQCPYYDKAIYVCRPTHFIDLPSLKCYLVQICMLLRSMELDRERKNQEEEDEWWKGEE